MLLVDLRVYNGILATRFPSQGRTWSFNRRMRLNKNQIEEPAAPEGHVKVGRGLDTHNV